MISSIANLTRQDSFSLIRHWKLDRKKHSVKGILQTYSKTCELSCALVRIRTPVNHELDHLVCCLLPHNSKVNITGIQFQLQNN